MDKDIAAYIRRIRKSHNLDQREFGERLGVARSTVAGWETGRRDPRAATLFLIDKLFGSGELQEDTVTVEYVTVTIEELRKIVREEMQAALSLSRLRCRY